MEKKSGFSFEKRKSQKGFTLAELLIVIAIVAILAMIAFANYKTQIDKGFDKKKKDHLSRLKTAFEEYFNDNNCYPASSMLNPCGEGADKLSPYLRIVPCHPQTDDPYTLVTEDGTICPQWFKIYTVLDFKKDEIIKDLRCYGGCGPQAGDSVNGSTTTENDYSYNYGVSSTNVIVGCEEMTYRGWDGSGNCKYLSTDGSIPDCEPYFCGLICREPIEECK